MEYVEWKKLNAMVSRVGFGAWGIGGSNVGQTSEIDSDGALKAYLEAGGNFLDTAPTYGDSERHIGRALKEFKNFPVFVATKSKWGETKETLPKLKESVENSLANLGVDVIDIFLLHMPPESDEDIDAALEVLEELKKEGKIRTVGASIKGPSVTDRTVALCKKYIDTGRIDVIELVYSILRQKNLEAMKYAREHGVEIIARTTLESGFLTGKYGFGYRFSEGDHRNRWNSRIDYIVSLVKDLQENHTDGMYRDTASLALGFALKEMSVSSITLGAKNPKQVIDNLTMAELPGMSDEVYKILQETFASVNDQCNPA